MKGKNRSGLRWFEAFAPSAQMFHGLGKGLGRGRGPRLAEPPVFEKDDDRRVLVGTF
ncbi:MAG TPA: hypothetical protein VFR69_10640 [Rubrobacteraceae bacterium]|nr:hypothetical protein [Rubrobacteraceae bacterium]